MSEEVIKELLNWAQNLVDFTSEQLPDVVNQIIQYEIYCNTMFLWLLWPVFIVCSGFTVLSVYVYFADKNSDYGYGLFVVFMLSMLLLMGIISCYSDIAKCRIAPKIVVLDYIKRFK